MSSYPLGADYQEALQYPSDCFTLPHLQTAQVITDALGLPYVESGQFAYVFRLRLETGRVTAIRCFARCVPDLQERYRQITRHLSRVRLPALANFEYEAQGVRIRGRFYPILQMEWVDGARLNRYIDNNIRNQSRLQQLSAKWLHLILQLEEQQVSHGDLQHGNVLVAADGTVRLVDYDGMWVPGMEGFGAIEHGHVNYQHPSRSRGAFGPGLDRFSALAIYVAILGLVENPSLWSRYDSGESILFQGTDFQRPMDSPLFGELLRLGGPALPYVKHLYAYCMSQSLRFATLEELRSTPAPEVTQPTRVVPTRLPEWVSGASRTPSLAGSLRGSVPPTPAVVTGATALGPPTLSGGRKVAMYVSWLFAHLAVWGLAAGVIDALSGWSLTAVLVMAVLVIGIVTGSRSARTRIASEIQVLQRRQAQVPQPLHGGVPVRGPSGPAGRGTAGRYTGTPSGPRTSMGGRSHQVVATGPFVASKLRSRYHRPGCEWAKKISHSNRVVFQTKAEALRHKYRPCGVCNP